MQQRMLRDYGQKAGLPERPTPGNVNVGHADPSGILVLDGEYEIDCEKKTLRLPEAATRQREDT